MNQIQFAVASGLAIGFGIFFLLKFSDAKREERTSLMVIFFLIAIIFFGLSGAIDFHHGRIAERTLNPAHTFIVKAKGQSSFGTPLLVYDEDIEEERTIVVKEYPPVGFIEVVIEDGEKVVLLPFKKK